MRCSAPNGAGKTTLIRILSTLLSADAGTARVAGVDVHRHPADVRKRIGLAGQYAAVDDYLTGRENIEMTGRLYGLSRRGAKSRATDVLQRIHLDNAADRQVKTYSGGMRRRIDLAASLCGRPQVLFLDEPTTGVSPWWPRPWPTAGGRVLEACEDCAEHYWFRTRKQRLARAQAGSWRAIGSHTAPGRWSCQTATHRM